MSDEPVTARNDRAALIGRAAIALATSVAVPILAEIFIASKTQPITAFEDVALGALTFLVLAASELALRAGRIEAASKRQISMLEQQHRREEEVWRVHDEIDARLINMRNYFRRLALSDPPSTGLYREYLLEALDDYLLLLHDAATTGSMSVTGRYIDRTDKLLECLHGSDEDVFRAVHCLSNNEFFFDMHSHNYFLRVRDFLLAGRVHAVHRLLVYDTVDEVLDSRTLKIVAFHHLNDQFDYRLLDRHSFRRILHDFGITEQFLDFGLYGQSYLYLSQDANDNYIRGVFKSSLSDLQKYRDVFLACWRSPLAWTADTVADVATSGLVDVAGLKCLVAQMSATELFNDALPGSRFIEVVRK